MSVLLTGGGVIPAPETFIFTISGPGGSPVIEYQCEVGMTWEEWCDSKYNVDGYHIIGGTVYPAETTVSGGWRVMFAYAEYEIEATNYNWAL